MKEILDLDEKIVEKTLLISWKKPYLKDQKDFILFLKDGLIQTEKCRRKGMKKYNNNIINKNKFHLSFLK